MKDMLKNYSLGAVACIVMGIALLINPHIITDVLNTAIGVILIVWAVFGILRFIYSRVNDNDDDDMRVLSLLANLVILAAGVYVFINTSLLETIVMLALGFYLICTGLPKVIVALKIRKVDPDRFVMPLVTSLLTTVCGVVVVLSPAGTAGTIMTIVGIVLIIAGISGFMSGFSTARFRKKLAEIGKDAEYARGRGRDKRDTTAEDKANAIDVEIDE